MELQTSLRLLNAIVVGLTIIIAIDGSGAQKPVALSDLTAPQERLPAGCALAAGRSIDLRVEANPWIGTDRSVVASIRERVDGPLSTACGSPARRAATKGYETDGFSKIRG
jgi:hypothetical protein